MTPAAAVMDTQPPGSELAPDAEKLLLLSALRQHESAVFTYLYRRVRRSVEIGPMAHEVFARLVAQRGLRLSRESVRSRLVELCQEVLSDFVRQGDPRDVAWTELCLELDSLVRQRHVSG